MPVGSLPRSAAERQIESSKLGKTMARNASVIGWSLAGALITTLAAAAWRAYIIVQGGHSLTAVPPFDMAFRVMELHKFALYGAIGGGLIGLIEKSYRSLRHRRRERVVPAYENPMDATDTKIKLMRAQRANEYLQARKAGEAAADQGLAPPVENVITAREGLLTYRVMAYRQLSERELMETVRTALENGEIEEPAPGGSVTLLTSIGKA